MTPTITESTEKLAALVAKVDAFVNGSEGTLIQTTSGPLKTMAGLIKQLEELNYTVHVVDYPTLSALLDGASADLEEGQLGRVLYDSNTDNIGIYQKTNLGMVKVDYADLFDLNDRLPNPLNRLVVKFTESDIAAGPKNILEAVIPVSASFAMGSSLSGRIEYTCDVGGFLSFATIPFALAVAGVSSGVYDSEYSAQSAVYLLGPAPDTQPSLEVVHAVVDSKHVFTIRLKSASHGAAVLPGNGQIIIDNVDLSIFKKL